MKGAEEMLRNQVKEMTDTPESELGNYPIEFTLDLVMKLETKGPPIVRVVIKYLYIFKCIVLISCPFSYYADCLLLHFL